MGPLSRAFSGAWSGIEADDRLEAALADSCAGARRAWSAIRIEDADFCAYLGERAPADATAIEALGKLRSDELFLCCGCARGNREALRAFDERFLARVNDSVAHLRLAPTSVDEARQQLRIKLLSPSDEAPPRIAQFRGHGSLEGWVRVAAVRTALTLTAAERLPGPRESLGGEHARAADPELDCLHARYRGVFATALRLSVRDCRTRVTARCFAPLPRRAHARTHRRHLRRAPHHHHAAGDGGAGAGAGEDARARNW